MLGESVLRNTSSFVNAARFVSSANVGRKGNRAVGKYLQHKQAGLEGL